MQKYIFVIVVFLSTFKISAQQPQKPSSVEIYNQIQKLNFLGTVLYVAAHPDDENTRLISWFSNEQKARTVYLSLTRGDGGQNLIGPELRELLGVIRTQELLEARKIDGGEQLFTRANDFGFSKVPDETLKIWDKNQVLSDVVWAIRTIKPDIIINRFDHRSPGTTHGHHTASAMLALEAFDLTNLENQFTDQLKFTSLWQAKRIFFNTSWWFYGSRENFEKADKSNLTKLNTGVYYKNLGKSNQEIAALSRSKHQSQGFGSTGTRGNEDEYLEFLKGENLQDKINLFEGIDTSWNRVKGGNAIGTILENVQKNFDFKNPEASIPELVKAYDLIQKLEDNHWKTIKSEDIKKIIAACAGLYLEAVANVQEITPDGSLKIKIEAINRSTIPIKLNGIGAIPVYKHSDEQNAVALNINVPFTKNITLDLPKDFEYTNPYWLNQKGTNGMYRVDNQEEIGIPDVIRNAMVGFWIEINGTEISFERKVVFKYNDDVKGEVYQPLDIVPVATSTIQDKVYIFSNHKEKPITVKIKAGKENISGSITLTLPNNWSVTPTSIPFSFTKKGEEQIVVFNVTPSKDASEVTIKSVLTIDGKEYNQEKIDINYAHISKQMILKPSEAKAIKLNIKTNGEKIAYIMGAGDEVSNSLSQMGYEVTIVKPDEITTEKLQKFDVVITGIRAYNVVKELEFKQNLLFEFVNSGKTMIVQYNTNDDLVTTNIAPYKLKISRDRVTEENAEVRFLEPNHKVLNSPNKITQTDFTGWFQEQGLYYPNEWDQNFIAIISSNDTNEKPKNGALLIAQYGKGNFVYTGLSFFRELPEGVTGAYRLLANMISLSK